MNMVYIWLIVAVLAVVAEAVTVQMVAIWFAPAALIAMLGAIFGAPLALQIVLFVLVSALCVVFLYKKLRKNIAEDCGKTNLDALIGATAKVETESRSRESAGRRPVPAARPKTRMYASFRSTA